MLFGFFGKTEILNRINRKPNARFTVSHIQFRFLFFINRISEKTEIPNRINSVNRMPRPSVRRTEGLVCLLVSIILDFKGLILKNLKVG
jgi:hypothetical protein